MMSSLQSAEEVQFLEEKIQNLQPLFKELDTFFAKTNVPKPFLWKNEVFFQDDLKIVASQKQFGYFNGQPDQNRIGYQGAQFPNHYQMQAYYAQQLQQQQFHNQM
jgi:hypothetical protein